MGTAMFVVGFQPFPAPVNRSPSKPRTLATVCVAAAPPWGCECPRLERLALFLKANHLGDTDVDALAELHRAPALQTLPGSAARCPVGRLRPVCFAVPGDRLFWGETLQLRILTCSEVTFQQPVWRVCGFSQRLSSSTATLAPPYFWRHVPPCLYDQPLSQG